MDFTGEPAFLSEDEKDQKQTTKRQAPKTKAKQDANEKTNKPSAIHGSSFKDFNLKPELLKAIGEAGFEHPSEGDFSSTTRRNSLHSLRRRSFMSSQKWNGKNSCFCFRCFTHY